MFEHYSTNIVATMSEDERLNWMIIPPSHKAQQWAQEYSLWENTKNLLTYYGEKKPWNCLIFGSLEKQ